MTDEAGGRSRDGVPDDVFEAYPAVAFVVDEDVRLLRANRAARRMVGPGVDLVLGSRGGEALRCVHSTPDGCGHQPPCAACVVRASVGQALSTGAIHRVRTFMQLAGRGAAEDVCVLVSAAPVEHRGATRVLLTLEHVADVSLKESVLRAERALSESTARATSLALYPEANPSPVLRVGADGTVVYANGAAREALGVEVGAASPAEVAEPARRARESRECAAGELSCGGRSWALTFKPIASEVNVYGHDVTDLRRTIAQLAAEKDRLRVTLASIGDGVIAMDERARVTLLNGVAEALTGWCAADAIGRPIEDVFRIVDERTRVPAENPASRALREGVTGALANHTALVARDGTERPVADSAAPIRDGSGAVVGAVLVFRDQTREREAEDALRASNRRLEEIDRNRTEFLAVLSHELRNPLAPIRNGLFVLDRAPPGSEQAARAKGVIDRQVEHLTRLVGDLLDVTRISHGKIALERERIDLTDLVRKTCDDNRAGFDESGLELHVDAPSPPVWVVADATRIAQVVGNLVQNAAKFTPRGGRVDVRVTGNDGRAEIAVRDTGIGIEAAELETLFEPFAQSDQGLARTRGGLGLGLALARGLVELHGGAIRADSAGKGKGAEFHVSLPLAAPGAIGARDQASDTPGRRGRRVLVIDDNADAAETLAELATMMGHTAEVALDGPSALEKARANPPDLVLCDIGLPGMSGYDVARALRRACGEALELVAVTGYAQARDVAEAMDAGFDGHVAKPLSREEVERLLAR